MVKCILASYKDYVDLKIKEYLLIFENIDIVIKLIFFFLWFILIN